MKLSEQNGAAYAKHADSKRPMHDAPRLIPVVEHYFEEESSQDSVVPLRLNSEIRERLDLPEPPVLPLPDSIHLANVVGAEGGADFIYEQAKRCVTHEPVRSSKSQTAEGVRSRISNRYEALEAEKALAQSKLAQHEEYEVVEQRRKTTDGKDVKLSWTQGAWLWGDRTALAAILALEGIVATNQVMNSFLPAGDHWLTAIAIGIPPVIGFFYALRARPLDLSHEQLPSFNETLSRRGVQLSVFVIVLFAFLLGESSGATSVFSSDSSGPSSWKQSVFTCSLMLLLAINAKNTFRLIRETQSKLVELVPVKNSQYGYWAERIARITQTQDANAEIGNEMRVIQSRIEREAELNADREVAILQQHAARVEGARTAGASQAAQRISELFSQN